MVPVSTKLNKELNLMLRDEGIKPFFNINQ